MTYVITGACATAKDMSCVEVCPADCIHPVPGEPGFDEADQLYIEATECIGCGLCVSACPVHAPQPESHLSDDDRHFILINAQYYNPI
jgi:NAD-dependent dihydropyrimidine dehydrogenase PreA subunit